MFTVIKHRRKSFRATATQYIIDDLSVGVDFAFSVSRYLSSTYVGSAVVKLREDNGDTTSDFKIVNGALVTNDSNAYTVSTWLSNASATNAYVQTWYDQSGNGNDIQQLTNGDQPIYVSSWTNGRSSVRSTGGKRLTTVSSFSANGSAGVSCYVALEEENSGSGGGVFGDPNSTTFGLKFNYQKPLYYGDFGGYDVTTTSDVSRAPHVISYEGDAGAGSVPITIRVDSVQDASDSFYHDKRSGTWVMFYGRASGISTNDVFAGHIGEMIYAEAEFSAADRDVVEDSMLNWFSIS